MEMHVQNQTPALHTGNDERSNAQSGRGAAYDAQWK